MSSLWSAPATAIDPKPATAASKAAKVEKTTEVRNSPVPRKAVAAAPMAGKAVAAEVRRPVAWLTRAIGRADAALAEAVKASPAWRAQDALLQSIPGVGPVATLTPLAGLPELGTTIGTRSRPRPMIRDGQEK